MSLTYLQHLQQATIIVADTGDIEAIKKIKPQEATTNPSLILSVAQQPQYAPLIQQIVSTANNDMRQCLQQLAVYFGQQILTSITGRVSIEVDARLSYNTQETIIYAQQLIQLFQKQGIDRARILIKIAATWEGIQAARQLEKEGIHCNLTLLFSFAQAVACAEAKVTLISPFVGRIFDWYKDNKGFNSSHPEDDPGVKFVTQVYNYFKKHHYQTEIMGASFRNIQQIMQLTGCDLLTISPTLLQELNAQKLSQKNKPYQLSKDKAQQLDIKKISCNQEQFDHLHNQDQMAKEKLIEGIDKFCQDTEKLEQYIKTLTS